MNNFRMEISNKIKGLIKYYDLGYVLNNIESLITLPQPIKNRKMSSKQFDIDRHISRQTEFEARIEFDSFSKEHDLRKDVFEDIKKEYPNFCLNMKNSVSNEEYQEYLSLLHDCSKKLEKLLISFNNRTNDNYHELLLEKKDSISDIIDNEDMSKLTYMQDNFVLNELSSIDCSKFDPQTQEKIEQLENDLNARISNYELFKKLYASKNVMRVKPLRNPKNNEER